MTSAEVRAARRRAALSWLLLAAVAISSTGCIEMAMSRMPQPALIREPGPERVPLRIGTYYPPELESYVYKHHVTDTAWILGKPSRRLLDEAFALLFADVVESPKPVPGGAATADLAGVIEARIVSAGFEYPKTGVTPIVFPTHVSYRFVLYSPAGQPLGSWDVTGRAAETVTGPSRMISMMQRNFEQAMREAAWNLTSGFRDVPEVRRWLEERGVNR